MVLRFVVFVSLLLTSALSFGQRQVITPQKPREADIHYAKRTWRVIELRERQNKVAVWPKNPLPKILYDAVLSGKLRAYKTDSLQSFYDLEEFVKLGTDTFLVRKLKDPLDDESYVTDTVVESFSPVLKIKQILIVEEWYFDNRQGQQRAQIIALAPLYQRNIAGIDIGYIPLCWLKYFDRTGKETDCRDVLVNQLMYNAGNPYQKFSYDDWFEQRNFSSFIIKESNPYDIYLMDDPEVKRRGLEALIESVRIKLQNMEEEHDMYEH